MRTAHVRSGLWVIGASSVAILLILSALSAPRLGTTSAFDPTVHLLKAAKAAIAEGYRVAPALMLGLAFAIGFPLIALASRVVRHVARSPDATRLYRRGYQPGRDDVVVEAEIADDAAPHVHLPFVEVEMGGKGIRCTIPRDMLRIGREEDNDIRIPSRAVHRYHAAIYREDYDWHITDLSGVEGNGLIVNGRRCCEARLSDGDLIQLGPGKLRFRAGLD